MRSGCPMNDTSPSGAGSAREAGTLRRSLAVLKRGIPDWQRIECSLDPFAQMIGRLPVAMAFGGQLELAHRLNIELEKIGLGAVDTGPSSPPIPDRPLFHGLK